MDVSARALTETSTEEFSKTYAGLETSESTVFSLTESVAVSETSQSDSPPFRM